MKLTDQLEKIDKQIKAEIIAENDSHRCACLIKARAELQECISHLMEAKL